MLGGRLHSTSELILTQLKGPQHPCYLLRRDISSQEFFKLQLRSSPEELTGRVYRFPELWYTQRSRLVFSIEGQWC